MNNDFTAVRPAESVLATNKVLRSTYMLLSLNFLFSAAVAGISMVTNAPYPGFLITIAGMYGLMFLTQYLRNSAWGLLSIFAFTGFLGYTMGPMLNMYLHTYANGAELIMTALGGTGVIFFGLSAYAITTKRDFSYLGGFLFVAVMTAILAMVANIFLQMPILQLGISAAFVLISSGMILFQTSLIIQGGERNYIMATISLFVALYNLFISLLHILSAFAGNRD